MMNVIMLLFGCVMTHSGRAHSLFSPLYVLFMSFAHAAQTVGKGFVLAILSVAGWFTHRPSQAPLWAQAQAIAGAFS